MGGGFNVYWLQQQVLWPGIGLDLVYLGTQVPPNADCISLIPLRDNHNGSLMKPHGHCEPCHSGVEVPTVSPDLKQLLVPYPCSLFIQMKREDG